ncbi:hypothetical protein ECANGB1_2079 [Enterospora canceri]|uniref:Uncharacterized protein n=1 Tax=Enterospora canceri TaxID=1081671 RepID=A0A1Y1S8Q3_9MICR|nr:hypothetical protein ECANGB1_2079 [Enterospora canceri]
MFFKVATTDVKYDTAESVRSLVANLAELSQRLTALDLSNNTYHPDAFASIAEQIKKMRNLKTASFESTMSCLDFEEMSSLCSMITNSLPNGLIALNLSSNALSCNFPNALTDFISRSNLVELNLYNCGLGREGIERVLRALEGLSDKTRLEKLNIGKNRMNSATNELGEIIGQFENLTLFKMAHNTVYEGLDSFLNGLVSLSLIELDISDNFVEEETALLEILGHGSLRLIHLRDIKTDHMDVILQKMVDTGSKIEHLDVSQNDLETEESMNQLVELAKHNQIRELHIYDNYFETDFRETYRKIKNLILRKGGRFIETDPAIMADEEEQRLAVLISRI